MEPQKNRDFKVEYIIFTLLGVGLIIAIVFCFWEELNPQWKKYQREFRKMEYMKTEELHEKQRLMRSPYSIRQIVVEKLGTVDRCTTCHLGVEDPRFLNEPEPFKTHPDYSQHPFEKYSCTVCHGGQGRAVTKDAAHGKVKHWDSPLLSKKYLEASCAKCHADVDPKITPQLVEGRRLFGEKACLGCHRVDGRGGRIGPDFSEIRKKRDAKWLIAHFKDPQAVVPGSKMPKLDLSQEEMELLTVYLLSKTGEVVPPEYQSASKMGEEIEKRIVMAKTPVEAGKAVFRKYGCATCHGEGGKGGIKNPNAQTGEEVPSLLYVKEGFIHKELKERIKEGATPDKLNAEGPDPLRVMPAWRDIITDAEIDALIEYLFSIYPSEAELEW